MTQIAEWGSLRSRAAARMLLPMFRERAKYEGSLIDFVEASWSSYDPSEYEPNWALDALCEHLQAVTEGHIKRLLVNFPPRCAKPVDEESFLLEKTAGRIKLRDIRVGHQVLTHRGRFRRVAAVHVQGELPVLLIETWSGRCIKVAPDHPVLTTHGWCRADEITLMDYLGCVTALEPCGSKAGITANECRLLGYLVGDGSVRSNQQPGVTSGSETVLSDIEDIVYRLGWFSRRKPNSRNSQHLVIKANAGRSRGNGKSDWRLWLERHELMGKTSYTKRVPPMVLAADRELIGEFVGAYWSCDGYISRRGPGRTDFVVGCDSVSRALLEDIQHLLLRLGIFAKIRKKTLKLKTKRQGEQYISWSLSLSRADDVAKFAQSVRIVHEKGKQLAGVSRCEFDRAILADQVVLIERHGVAACRCLSIEEDGSFVAQDLAVKNTNIASVCWPAWTWARQERSYLSGPQVRFLCGSYNDDLALQNSTKHRRLLLSPWYQKYWGKRVKITLDQNTKTQFDTSVGGSRISTSARGSLLGIGGDIICVDDPHNTRQAESEAERLQALNWWREISTTRLNDPSQSAIVVIMQRLHEEDVSGVILSSGREGWCHLCIPMQYEWRRHCVTVLDWEDPRGLDDDDRPLVTVTDDGLRVPRDGAAEIELEAREGELMWPERFDEDKIREITEDLGPYFASGRLQQMPVPAKGGIFKREWWRTWEGVDGKFPLFDHIVASLDSAFTEKEENDPSGFTCWGIWYDTESALVPDKGGQFWHRQTGGQRRVMLIHAWRKHLEMHGEEVLRKSDEPYAEYVRRSQPKWGLVEWVAHTCRRFKVDKLLIESKASGITAAQEMQRLYGEDAWSTQLEQVQGDKVARAHAVVPAWSQGLIYAPDRDWADLVIDEMATFPKGRYKDLTDSATQAIKYMRVNGLIQHEFEREADERRSMMHRKKQRALYPA